MKTVKTLWLVPTFILLSIGLYGQDTKSDVLSYSLSYIPPPLISRDADFKFVPIYINFEANIHYKPFDRISFSSGLGYFINITTIPYPNWGGLRVTDDYHTITETNFRIPMQFNYHWWKSPDYPDWYFKAVYTNAISYFKSRSTGNDVVIQIRNSDNLYRPSVGLGIGGIFLKNKPVGLIVEGTIEKTLRWETFSDATYYSLKIGIVL